MRNKKTIDFSPLPSGVKNNFNQIELAVQMRLEHVPGNLRGVYAFVVFDNHQDARQLMNEIEADGGRCLFKEENKTITVWRVK